MYKACRAGVVKIWLREAIRNCPNAEAFLKLPPLKAKKAPLNYQNGLGTGFEMPLLRIRRRVLDDQGLPVAVGNVETAPSEGQGIFGFPILKRDAYLRAVCISAVNISRSSILEKHGFGQRARDLMIR